MSTPIVVAILVALAVLGYFFLGVKASATVAVSTTAATGIAPPNLIGPVRVMPLRRAAIPHK